MRSRAGAVRVMHKRFQRFAFRRVLSAKVSIPWEQPRKEQPKGGGGEERLRGFVTPAPPTAAEWSRGAETHPPDRHNGRLSSFTLQNESTFRLLLKMAVQCELKIP